MDEARFLEIIETYYGLIKKICMTYTDCEDDEHDLYQDIVLQLWKAYPTFRHESKICTWIYRVAFNTAVSNIRKRKKETENAVQAHGYYRSQNNKTNETNEQISGLFQLIKRLNKLDRAIIMLYMDNQSYSEIARIMGISETNVATKINRIKLKLKEYSKIDKPG